MTHLMRSTLLASALSCAILIGPTATLVAQEKPVPFARNAIYFEVFGQGVLYSINYDYRLTPNIGLRAGFSYWSIVPFFLLSTGELKFTDFPLTVNYLTGRGTSHFEMGVGVVPVFISLDGHDLLFGSEIRGSGRVLLGTATIGYRAQPRDGGFIFRIGLTPLFTFKHLIVSGGLSFGVAF